MSLGDMMEHNIKTCRADDTLRACAKMMMDNRIGFLPVVDNKGILIGTITDRDIVLRAVAAGKNADSKVRDFFSDNPVHLHASDDIAEAENVMMQGHIRRLVIVDDQKKPIGVVSISDIVMHEKDFERLHDVLCKVFERTPQERTVEELVGSACCG